MILTTKLNRMDSSRQSPRQCLRVWENDLPTVLEMDREMANSTALINWQHNNKIPWVSSHKAALLTLGKSMADLIWMCQITLTIGKSYPSEAEEIFKSHEMKPRTWKLNSWPCFCGQNYLQVSKVTTVLRRKHFPLHPKLQCFILSKWICTLIKDSKEFTMIFCTFRMKYLVQ